MSVAFRREGDDEHKEPVFEVPIAPGRNLVTVRGLVLIEAQITRIEGEIAATPDEDAVKRLRRELRYWQTRRSTAEIVIAEDDGMVGFGTRVTIRGRDGERTFAIVGGDEAAPANGLIGFHAPLARALADAPVGERIAFQGDRLEIVAVHPIDPE